MIKAVIICIILGIVPLLLGKLFTYKDDEGIKNNHVLEYVLGFLGMLAIFEVLCVPMTYLRISFTTLTIVYTIVLTVLCVCGLCGQVKILKKHEFVLPQKLEKYEYVYIGMFVVLLVVQLYCSAVSHITYMSYDDYDYIVTANMAIYDDGMFLSDVVTGYPMKGFTANRVLNAYLIFVAYLAKISGFHVTVIAHTILPVFLILFAYSGYYVIAQSLFKEREHRWIFMVLLSMIVIFGEFTKYSMTFRLLGPVWNGKGVLIAVTIPFLFGLVPLVFEKKYHFMRGMYFLLISIAACSMTLMGAVMPTAIIGVYSLYYLWKCREKKYVYYMMWGCIVPVLFMGAYFILR